MFHRNILPISSGPMWELYQVYGRNWHVVRRRIRPGGWINQSLLASAIKDNSNTHLPWNVKSTYYSPCSWSCDSSSSCPFLSSLFLFLPPVSSHLLEQPVLELMFHQAFNASSYMCLRTFFSNTWSTPKYDNTTSPNTELPKEGG
jgi:hypothetical protein